MVIESICYLQKRSNIKIEYIFQQTKTNPGLFKKECRIFLLKCLDKRKKVKPIHKIRNLVWTAFLKKTFSKPGSTNWSYELHEIREIVKDAIPSYKVDRWLERYNQALLKNTKLTLKEKKSSYKKTGLKLNQNAVEHHC